jgi:anti-sigma regulatory factor (Ser/Thr protein kinase)
MTQLILKIPPSKNAQDWFLFLNKSLENLDQDINKLIIDFNSIYFLQTDDFVVLACLIESFYSDSCTVEFIGGTENFNAHLDNIKFKKYWSLGFNREKFTLSYNRSTLCLWKISNEMIYSYSDYAKKYFKNTFLSDKDLVPLASNLGEVFNNIFDHSNSPIDGYVITQYFPTKKKLSFSVCDFGIGIAASINNYYKEKNINKVEDWEALLKSITEGFSIESTPQNRGMGLSHLIDFTESSNGELTIISNNGVLSKKFGENYSVGSSNFNFNGTLIKVEVDSNTFDEYDESEEIYDL